MRSTPFAWLTVVSVLLVVGCSSRKGDSRAQLQARQDANAGPAEQAAEPSSDARSAPSIDTGDFRFFAVEAVDKRFGGHASRIHAVSLPEPEPATSDEELYLNAAAGRYERAAAGGPFLLMGSLPGGRHPSPFKYRVVGVRVEERLISCDLDFTYIILPGAGPSIPQIPYFVARMPAMPEGEWAIEFRVMRSYIQHGDALRVPREEYRGSFRRDALEIAPYRVRFSLPNALFDAAQRGSLARARALLRQGADVNARNELGETPLFGAVMSGSLDMVTLLIENGADVNAREQNGATALNVAGELVGQDRFDAMRGLLRRHGAVEMKIAPAEAAAEREASTAGEDKIVVAAQVTREDARDGAVIAVVRYVRARRISGVDLSSARIINTTDEYWDVSLDVPDAVRSGEMPNARIFRVARPGAEVTELGTD